MPWRIGSVQLVEKNISTETNEKRMQLCCCCPVTNNESAAEGEGDLIEFPLTYWKIMVSARPALSILLCPDSGLFEEGRTEIALISTVHRIINEGTL